MKFYYQIFISVTFFLLGSKAEGIENEKKNGYDLSNLKDNDSVYSKQDEEKNEIRSIQSKRRLEKWESIEIYVDLKAIQTDFNKTAKYYSFLKFEDINSAVNEVKETLNKLIKVKITTEDGNRNYLTIKRSNDLGDLGFDDDHYETSLAGPGVKKDLIILIRYYNSNIDDDMNDSLFAKPSIIQKSSDGRPEVGIVVLFPKFGLTETNKKEYLKFLFLHEFTHILGFLPEYLPKLQSDTVNIKRISQSGINKAVIKSPKVINHANNYFGCKDKKITYLELEEQTNFEGLTNCHWDARILLGEYMTAEPYFGDQVISEFTLYLLEDLEFYETNKYTGGLMKFGKNRGCSFLGYDNIVESPSDCVTREASGFTPLSYYEFCLGGYTPTCSSGRQSRTYCVRPTITPDTGYSRTLSTTYTLGRRDADYCPVSDTFTEDEDSHYVGNCKLGNGSYGINIFYENTINEQSYDTLAFDDKVGQKYSDNSFCALSSLVNDDYNYGGSNKEKYKERIRPTCYQMFCTETSLTIKLYQQYFVCPQEGGIINNITNYEGYIYCPDYNLICTGTVLCNNMFDCVDKNSKAKNDLKHEVTPKSDGSLIEGVEKNSLIPSDLENVKGYELSDDENSKCPKNCFQCLEHRQCFECKEGTYYKGTSEKDEKPIECVGSVPENDYHYNVPNYDIGYNISKKLEQLVYFDCISGCKKCHNGEICDTCSPTHYLNNAKCIERIPHCKIYDNTSSSSVVEHSDDNNGELAYTECAQCNNEENFYCLKFNGIDDLKKCYNISEFKNPIFCRRARKSPPSDDACEIITNTTLTDNLREVSISTLVKDYIDAYEPYTKKINHFINEEKDYTITIFMNSSCTEELLKSGYYNIYDDEITKKLIETNTNIYEQNEPNERPITVFITYGVYNYYLTVFSLDRIETHLDECEECKNLEVKIGNNFSSIINQTLGEIVLSSVKYGEFDVFNESAGEFTTLCRNVTLLGVDVPLFRRKNYFYVHKFSKAYSCRSDNCTPTEKIFIKTTANCICEHVYEINPNYTSDEFTFYNISSSKDSKAGDAFKVFGCVEDTFDSRHLKKNFGFYFSLISIILQIILFIIYCIAGKPINFSKGTIASKSNPPKRVAMKINADWIKANLLKEHDEEKDIQSKDEIDDEFVMEEFNYNIDKHDTSSYSVDTDLAKKQIGDNKETEKDGLTEKPDGKKKKKILILLPDKTKPEDSDMIDDDLLPSKDKKQEKKNFFQIYWLILSLKQHIINYFSGFKWLKITESYVPKFIMGIRSLFTIVFVFFVNAMFLSQDYYDEKFAHFNQKYGLVPGYGKIKISGSEKFNYGLSHTAAYAFYTFLIFLIVQLLFGIFVFSVRKELTELFNSKDVLKINSLAKTLKAKYIVYFVIVIVLMIAFFMYLTNFNGAYAGSGNDFGPAGLLSLIFIEIFPFVWSLILAIFRYFGIACQNKVLFGISQVFMF